MKASYKIISSRLTEKQIEIGKERLNLLFFSELELIFPNNNSNYLSIKKTWLHGSSPEMQRKSNPFMKQKSSCEKENFFLL